MTAKKKSAGVSRLSHAASPAKGKRVHAVPQRVVEHFEPSGIDEALIEQLKIVFVEPIGRRAGQPPVAAFCIPYFDLHGNVTGFQRYRLDAPYFAPGKSKPQKYWQPPGTGNHLYLPPVGGITWSDVADDAKVAVLITEGEKKAACATARGFPAIGIGGIQNWKSQGEPIDELDWFDWTGREVFIAFDSPDVQKNKAVADAASALGSELTGRGASVRFIQLPSSGDKVGLDDFLVRQGDEALRALMADATNEPVDAVGLLNAELALVDVQGVGLVLREERTPSGQVKITLSAPHQIAPIYENIRVSVPSKSGTRQKSAFDLWLGNDRRRTYRGLVFEPGQASADRYNLWSGFAVTPIEGDCRLFIEHVEQVICSGDKQLSEYVLSWMAHAVQRPAELPETALILRGRQGTGKSLFCNLFGQLFGQHFVVVSHAKHLVGSFNKHLEHALVVLAEEAFWAGDHHAEGVLKTLISDKVRMIEGKFREPYPVSNFVRLMVATNADWAVPAGIEERRMVVIEVSDAKMQDHAYFRRLRHQMATGGAQALMHWLMGRDISTYDPRAIPKTQALFDQKINSLDSTSRFVFELLVKGVNSEGGRWERIVPKATIYGLYLAQTEAVGTKRREAESKLGKCVKRLLPGCRGYKGRLKQGGPQLPLWEFGLLKDRRAEFERTIGQPIDWEAAAGE